MQRGHDPDPVCKYDPTGMPSGLSARPPSGMDRRETEPMCGPRRAVRLPYGLAPTLARLAPSRAACHPSVESFETPNLF
jgi:hypothetical protein